MRRRESGFTLVELLVSVVVLLFGILGTMGVYRATVRSTSGSRDYDEARVVAADLMETTRAQPVATLEANQSTAIADVTSPTHVTYQRSYSVTQIVDQPNLVRVRVVVTFNPEGTSGTGTQRRATLEMVRTRQENI